MMEEESFSTSTSTSTSRSCYSSNVRSELSEQNTRDDLTAPAAIRLAAQELRAFISADSTDGLTSHRFHIKKRENPEKKQKKNVTANQHACWCAVCDVFLQSLHRPRSDRSCDCNHHYHYYYQQQQQR